MKKAMLAFTIMLLSGFVQTALWAETAPGPESVPRIAKEQVKAQLGNSDFAIIDVRSAHDWEDSYKLGSWIDKYPKNKTIVLYCK
jgi:hypothetical protein